MKKLLLLLVALTMAISGRADSFTVYNDDLLYQGLNSWGGKPICKVINLLHKSSIGVSIPESVYNGATKYTIVAIGTEAFKNSAIQFVHIPKTVTSIASKAFWGCWSLNSVVLPNSITRIDDSTFRYCTSLTSVSIPNSVTEISTLAFCDCSSLASVTIPGSVTSIGGGAFENCTGLASVTIPGSVKNIGGGAFEKCGLKSIYYNTDNPVELSDNVFSDYSTPTLYVRKSALKSILLTLPWRKFKNIEVYDFGDEPIDNPKYTLSYTYHDDGTASVSDIYTVELCDVEIPETTWDNGKTYKVTSIKDLAFRACVNMKSLKIPDCVTSIGDDAFVGCKNLSSVTIPNSITKLGYGIFRACKNLDSVTIPASVTSIGDYAFDGCSSLSSVSIPNSVTTIGNHAFDDCRSLSSVSIPNSVTSIGNYAFYYCTSLSSVTIPTSVTKLGDGIFRNCKSLSSVTIPVSVTSIGNSTFHGCTKLSSVSIPASVTSIGDFAFCECSIKSVVIPNSIKSIGSYAFKNCNNLKEIYYLSHNPIEVDDYAFLDFISPTLYVSESALDKISITIPWRSFMNIEAYDINGKPLLQLDTESHQLAAGKSVVLKLKKSGNLSELTWTSANPKVATVDSDGTVTAVGVGETTITVSATNNNTNEILSTSCTVQVITEERPYLLGYAIDNKNLTCYVFDAILQHEVAVVVPEYFEHEGKRYKVTGIVKDAFAGNDKLVAITIPATVYEIDPGSFKGCANLEIVNYNPVKVNTTTSHHANPVFADCPKFKTLNIGETVKEIPSYMFKATAIETLDIPDNVESLRSDCFADCYELAEIRIGRGVTIIDCAAFALGSFSSPQTKVYCNARKITYYRGLGGNTNSYLPFSKRTVVSIEFGPDVERLSDYAFTDLQDVTDIYCNSLTPPVVDSSNVLSRVVKSSCTLHVPAESLQLYKTAYFWKDFYTVVGDVSGIEEIEADVETKTEVYNLSGLKVSDSLEGLSPGLYIVRRGSKVEKVMVR